jgi:hypothetical protein
MKSVFETDTDENKQLLGAAMAVCQIIIRKIQSGEISKDHPGAARVVENLMWLVETGELPEFDMPASQAWENTFPNTGGSQ